MHSLYAEVIV